MGLWIITLKLTELLAKYGLYGLFAGSFLSSLFIPLGADILFVGLLAAGINPWECLFVATLGGWFGGLVIYYIGYYGNPEKIRRTFRIKPGQLEKQKNKIDKYGVLMALLVWVPVIGDLANVALGFYRIKPKTTLLLMFVGRMVRFLLWVVLYLIFAGRFIHFFKSL